MGGSAPSRVPDGPDGPDGKLERFRALAAGELTPVPPRRAATVLLLQDRVGDGSPAVYIHMLRRRTSMAFAGGAYAYPGGAVDPRDEQEVAWAGPDRSQWADRLGTAAAQRPGDRPPTARPARAEAAAQAIVCAAVRETFEETGVLLAGPDRHSVVADTTGEAWEADRAALAAGELSFAELLRRRQLVLRSDLLEGWARWITPEFETRRYDTWFFVAALPAGQRTRNASTEADRVVWIEPAQAAAGYDRGELHMLPPTITTLRELLPYRSTAAALAAARRRSLDPVRATVRLEGGRLMLCWPGHDASEERIPLR